MENQKEKKMENDIETPGGHTPWDIFSGMETQMEKQIQNEMDAGDG